MLLPKGRLIVACLLLLFTWSVSASTLVWYEQSSGFTRSERLAVAKHKPLVIYFRTDGCGYCKRFESEYLDDLQVDLLLSRQLRVKLNPENSAEEKALAVRFDVQGYPHFIVYDPDRDSITKLSPLRKGKDWDIAVFRRALTAILKGDG